MNQVLKHLKISITIEFCLFQTWSTIESNHNATIIGNLRWKIDYLVCLRCRQTLTDPTGSEECQNVTTLKRFGTLNHLLSDRSLNFTKDQQDK
jgi:hypothetical protein